MSNPSADDFDQFRTLIHKHFDRFLLLSDGIVGQLYQHHCLLERWNRVLNLSSIRTLEEAVVRHYCESLFVGLHLPAANLRVVDVGSGAGFPGLPIAMLRRDCEVSLVESHQRKAVFLKEASRGLENVRVLSNRAEQIPGKFDWLTSRAVAWEDLRAFAPKLAPRVMLLVSEANAAHIARGTQVAWEAPVPLPWGRQQVLLAGYVSRGT